VLPLTPLIDISLMLAVLLIAVMRADPESKHVPVQLPEAETGQKARPGFVISIAANGTVSLGQDSVDVTQLSAAAVGKEAAIIRADGAVAHSRVVAVVDILRKAGVSRILYATNQGVVEW
jgi:biopolymer transport protein ExbD